MSRRRSGLAVLPFGTADTCPVCQFDHKAMDPYWTCPKHRHHLKLFRRDGDWNQYRCPAWRCQYTRSAPPKPRSPSQGDSMTTAMTRPSVAVDTMRARAVHLLELLPPGLDVGSFMGSAQAALYNNPALMAAAESDKGASLMIALTECAALGHMPGSKEYYLTPRSGKVLGIEGYRGIVERFYRSGEVAKVAVREVCTQDYFRYVEGEDDCPVHRFGDTDGTTGADFFGPTGRTDRGPMVGVYCAVQGNDGHWYRPAILSRDDVLAARDSGGYKAADPYSPWNRYDAGKDQPGFQGRSMWWKTAAKRAEPWTPTSSEDKRAPAAPSVQAEQVPQRASVTLTAAPAPAAAVTQEKRKALPPARQKAAQADAKPTNGGVVTAALNTAISAQFGRLGVDDKGEQENWVRKLNQDAEGELTEHQLRFALGALSECEDLAALIDLCAVEAS